jgi:hypothetical protein
VPADNPQAYPELKAINLDLKKYLLNIFKQKMSVAYVVNYKNLIIHRDRTNYFINYIIDVGGEDMKTAFFDHSVYPSEIPYYDCRAVQPEKFMHLKVHEEVLPEKTWVKLNTHVPHCVFGNLTRPRIYLSIVLEEFILPDLPLDKRPIFE